MISFACSSAAGAAAVLLACRLLPAQSVLTAANGAVERPGVRGPLGAADSLKVLRAARTAQGNFERLRFNSLPWTWDRSSSACDERVGRFCIWHGDEDDEWLPPPEKNKVRSGRTALIAKLEAAAAALPGDDWIAGQRVRYLLESGRQADARPAAAGCAGTRWWCAALTGLVRHAAGEFDAADSAFAEALRTMPAVERRAWTDLTPLLAPGDRDAYRAFQGPQRDSVEARFWWLADPLWGTGGNDRRTEHYARRVMDRLQDRARTTDGMRWGTDLGELLLRYGWSAGMERVESRPTEHGPPNVVSHFPRNGREFLPSLRFLTDPAGIKRAEWDIHPDRPQTEYAPSYATFGKRELEHQFAAFRRGDSVVLVAAYELSADTADSIPSDGPVSASLVAALDERTPPVLARLAATGRTGALSLATEPRPLVLSLEALTDAPQGPASGRSPPGQPPPGQSPQRHAARARYGLLLTPDPGTGVSVSDVLLLTAGDRLPGALDEAVALARGSTTVRAGERVGLYWEVYGLRARGPAAAAPAAPESTGRAAAERAVAPAHSDTVDLALTLVPPKGGWMRRAAVRLSLRSPVTPVQLQWRESLAEGPVMRRAIALQIPALPPGRYTLRVTATPLGRAPAVAERVIEVAKESSRR